MLQRPLHAVDVIFNRDDRISGPVEDNPDIQLGLTSTPEELWSSRVPSFSAKPEAGIDVDGEKVRLDTFCADALNVKRKKARKSKGN